MRTESYSERQQPVPRPKIMVVDDDPDLRQALSLRLRANHFETLNVCDGYSAIRRRAGRHQTASRFTSRVDGAKDFAGR